MTEKSVLASFLLTFLNHYVNLPEKFFFLVTWDMNKCYVYYFFLIICPSCFAVLVEINWEDFKLLVLLYNIFNTRLILLVFCKIYCYLNVTSLYFKAFVKYFLINLINMFGIFYQNPLLSWHV